MQNKRGQITLFIIIAIVIIAVVVLFLVLRGRMTPGGMGKAEDPEAYIEDCAVLVIDELELTADLECTDSNCYGNKPYLCYNDIEGADCMQQTPIADVTNDEELRLSISKCIDNSIKEFGPSGASRCSEDELVLDLSSENDELVLHINCPVTITSADKTYSYDSFDASVPCIDCVKWPGKYKIFEPLAMKITETESSGAVETETITELYKSYPDFTISVTNPADHVSIYELETGEDAFQFAIKEMK